MEKLTGCPICHSPLLEIGEGELGCNNCKRIWVALDDMWVSKARPVRIKREPHPGDSPDDFLEGINDEET